MINLIWRRKSYNDEKTKSERLIANLEENVKELKKEKRKTQALEVESRRLTNESEQAKETHEEALKRNAERTLHWKLLKLHIMKRG